MATIKCARCDGMLIKDIDHCDGGQIEVVKCVICGHRVASRTIKRERGHEKRETIMETKRQADAAGLPPDAGDDSPEATTMEPSIPKKSKKPVRVCAECGKERRIVGRGLCSGCYSRLRENGTLDEKHPPKKHGAPAGNKSRANAAAKKRLCETVEAVDATDLCETVSLRFDITDQRDAELLAKLQQAAVTDRRTLDAEIMALLETVVDA